MLVEVVKLVQKRGIKGTQGDWKEFLNGYDKRFGANLSDPGKRTNKELAAFLKTLTLEEDVKVNKICVPFFVGRRGCLFVIILT